MFSALMSLVNGGVPRVPGKFRSWASDRSLPSLQEPVSQLCTKNQFDEPTYAHWVDRMREPMRYHRKQWEFVFILQSLAIHGMLQAGRSGLGFGVGHEPLPSLMASLGLRITGTDLPPDGAVEAAWAGTQQHAASLEALNTRGLCPDEAFSQLVDFRHVDMNHIPPDLQGYDFCWSSCAFEHLGSIDLGLRFVEESLKCVRPGGLVVHTTEYNCQSNNKTLTEGGTVIFRQRDFLLLAQRLRAAGHRIVMNLNQGDQDLDRYIDLPPYTQDQHLKLRLAEYVTTSIGLVVHKAG